MWDSDGARHRLHLRIHESQADLRDVMRPTLILIDGYQVLIRNRSTGGSLTGAVMKKKARATGAEPVAFGAYVAKAYQDFEAN